MGILNITPDSFSDGGELYSSGKVLLDKVLWRAEAMLAAGARMLDVGGESSRPGAKAISETEEADRVLPVVCALNERFETIISVDTSRVAIMRSVAKTGASMINDVRAMQAPGALQAVSETTMSVVLMHMQGQPADMQNKPEYTSVFDEVQSFLQNRKTAAIEAGIKAERIILDPGIGFGKTLEHNLRLIGGIKRLQVLGCRLMLGVSRKSLLGKLTGRPEKERLPASIAAALAAASQNVQILRVHDVPETIDAIKVWQAIQQYQ